MFWLDSRIEKAFFVVQACMRQLHYLRFVLASFYYVSHILIFGLEMAKVNLIFFLFVVIQNCVNFPWWRFWCFSWSTVKLLTFNNRINSRKPLKRNGSCKGGFTYVYLKKPWFFLLFWNGKVGHCLKCVLLFLDEKMGILESMNKDTRLLIFNRYDRK